MYPCWDRPASFLIYYSFKKNKHQGSRSLSFCHLCVWDCVSSPNTKLALYLSAGSHICIHRYRYTHTQSNNFFFVLIRIFVYSFFYQTVNVIKHKSLLTIFGSIIFILVSLMILVVNFGKSEF